MNWLPLSTLIISLLLCFTDVFRGIWILDEVNRWTHVVEDSSHCYYSAVEVSNSFNYSAQSLLLSLSFKQMDNKSTWLSNQEVLFLCWTLPPHPVSLLKQPCPLSDSSRHTHLFSSGMKVYHSWCFLGIFRRNPFAGSCDVSRRHKHKTKVYLKVFVDERLPVRFDLSELWPQAFDLALHPHDVLKVPLRSQVQHLDWLRHVLHLLKRMKQHGIDFSIHSGIKMSSMFSRSVACHAPTSQGINQHSDLNVIVSKPSMCELNKALRFTSHRHGSVDLSFLSITKYI